MMSSDQFLSQLAQRCPELDRITASRLAEAWSALQDRIIRRMMAICDTEVGSGLHIEQRAEVAFEMAKLLVFVNERILDEKAKSQPLSAYDPAAETMVLNSSGEQAKVENTARILADHIWKPFLAELRQRRPLLEVPGAVRAPMKLRTPVKPSFRSHMHYVPQSTIRQWASAKSGKFNVYTIGIDGEVRSTPGTAQQWAAASFLYTQSLEHYLSLVEGDARRPYDKLINVVPLDESDIRRWIAFLITQYIRTPSFMSIAMRKQRAWIKHSGIEYPTDAAHLGRAFETLFYNNKFYAALYRLITGRRWSVFNPADGLTFLKGDNPVVICGNRSSGTWRLLYPLTPHRCFVAGPAREDELWRVVPNQRKLSDAETIAMNAEICAYSENSVIGVGERDRIDPRPTIKTHLRKEVRPKGIELPIWGLASAKSDRKDGGCGRPA